MAEPLDSAVFLEDVSGIVQQQYFPEFVEESPQIFGKTTNRLFKPAAQEITGDGKTMQYEWARGDTVRAGNNPLGPFAAPSSFQEGTVKVRFNKQTASLNDFTDISASAQVDDIDLQERGKGSIVDFVDRIFKQVMPNFDEHLAVLRHLPRSAVIGTLDGSTVARNNSWYWAGSTATASNTNGLRAILSGGSIAAIRPGTRLDFLNPTTFAVNAGNVTVQQRHPPDKSFGVAFVSTGITGHISTGNLANVGVSDAVTFSGEYGKGLYSLGAWFSRPTAGESFIGGEDRTTAQNQFLIVTATRDGATSTKITKSMFNDLAIAMNFQSEDPMAQMVWMMDPTIHQALRDEIGEDAFIQIPVDDSRMQRFANFGTIGLNYQHGQFGLVKLLSDPLCPPNTIRVINPETWRTLYYGWKGLRSMGPWYRMNEGTPNQGLGKIWKSDWYALMCDWCFQPFLNGAILNVTAT